MADGSCPFALERISREPYTPEELDRLRSAYKRGGIIEAMKACPTRSRGAIVIQMTRMRVHSKRSWSKLEVRKLRALYPLLGPTGCQAKLKRRSYTAIAQKAQQLGLTHEAHWWTDAEREAVTQAYASGGIAAVRALGLSCSEQAALGVTQLPSARNWTSSELKTLRHEWLRGGIAAASAALPNRTRIAVKAKGRELKLHQPHAYTDWDATDRRMLRKLYPAHGIAGTAERMSWRTPRSIRHMAKRLKLAAPNASGAHE